MLNKKSTSIENVLISLANAVEAKDAYTQGYTKRVADMAVDLGKRIGLLAIGNDVLRLSRILHDIGKIRVPAKILNKPGPFDSDEWDMIKDLPAASYRICLPLKKILEAALEMIRIVDIFDALDSDRLCRKGLPREKI